MESADLSHLSSLKDPRWPLAVVAFLNSASEVRFFLLAEFANPQVYHMFCFNEIDNIIL